MISVSSKVEKNGKLHRPTWNYQGEGWKSYDQSLLMMMESCRNVLEDVVEQLETLNSLLNCPNFVGFPTTLRNIEANTRKPVRKPKVKK